MCLQLGHTATKLAIQHHDNHVPHQTQLVLALMDPFACRSEPGYGDVPQIYCSLKKIKDTQSLLF